MFGGKGYYKGSTILISGTAGSGKTSLAAHFADSCCRRGEKVLYVALKNQRPDYKNMNSIG
jgi:circadian clock protein KaiC